MALNPSQSRLNNSVWGARSTPNNSPFARSNTIKTSPTKSTRADAGLSLRHVIGTTANSSNAISTHHPSRSLAFIAGAAAVLATFDEHLKVSQRFYRARPTAIPLNPTPVLYSPSTPVTPGADLRTRAAVSLRDAGATGSPYGTPTGDWADSPGGKPWSARERVKAATCVSLSPDGKYLAVGETGYKPRVLIFSTSKESSSDAPLTCLPDHTFGVRAVAFSPDSQYLATLGAANDGYLYIWKINNRNGAATLFASNKCTSNISQIAWMGKSVVTVGTRHVKIWRVEGSSSVSTPVKATSTASPACFHRILYGRNCLLNELIESTFAAVVAISPTKAIVCSESGDICLLDDSTGNQLFTKVGHVDFSVTAICRDVQGNVLVTGREGSIRSISCRRFLDGQNVGHLEKQLPEGAPLSIPTALIALAPLDDHIVAVDASRFIKLIKPPSEDTEALPDVKLRLPAHGGPVLGVRPCATPDHDDIAFFTWSAEGTILFWTQNGVCKRTVNVELEQADSADDGSINELRVVRSFSKGRKLITGDKYGVLRIIDSQTGECGFISRAHAGEITDVAVQEGKVTLIATGGRDRTVQIFQKRKSGWDLIQTLDEHVGAITGLLFTSDGGGSLISSSSDRNIVVREGLTREADGETTTAFVIKRTIALKNTPISMTLPSDRDDVLFLSAVDRSVHRYNLRTGHLSNSFKVSDNEGSDAVVLSSLIYIPTLSGQNLIGGVSTTDKSLRLYDENGVIFGRDWGHTEGVTDLTLVRATNTTEQRCLVSVAADGTVFIWSIGPRQSNKRDISRSMDLLSTTPTGTDLLVNKPPLRRVLSQTELSHFQQRSSEAEADSSTPPIKRNSVTNDLKKRVSRFSLAQPPRLDPSPLTTLDKGASRRRTLAAVRRSPSPPSSPKSHAHRTVRPRPSLTLQRTKSSAASPTTVPPSSTAAATHPTGVGTLAHSTDVVVRNLRAYRKKLAAGAAPADPPLPDDALRLLERELALTARAVSERARARGAALDDAAVARLLDVYSERLVEVVGRKVRALGPDDGRRGSGASGEEEVDRKEDCDALRKALE